MLHLRPYQENCLCAIHDAAKRGVRRQLIVQATGLGKAVQAASLPGFLKLPKDRRMLVLVHRDELCFQMAEKCHKYNPSLTIGMEKADYRADHADIVIGSVQTLGRATFEGTDGEGRWEYGNRIRQFSPEQFPLIQVDESHHLSSKAKQWLSVLRYFRVLKGEPDEDKRKILCGWTATPNRNDQQGLEVAFDEIVFNYGIREAIQDKWLAPIVGWRIETEVDLSRVHTVAGDFDVASLTDAINTPERNELICRKYAEICPGESALFFTSSIAHSHDLAESLRSHGFRIFPISGKTPDRERRDLIQSFKEGSIQGLTSCSVLSEGVDLPNARVGVMARPTKSGLLYRQQIGRILRPSPSPEELQEMFDVGRTPDKIKPDAIVIDVVDSSGRHRLCVTPTLFGLRDKFDLRGRSALETADEVEAAESANPGLDLSEETDLESVRRKLERLKTTAHRIDLLGQATVPPEVRGVSRLVWLKDSEDSYHLSLMSGDLLSVRQNALGGYDVHRHVKGIRTKLWVSHTLREAILEADRMVPDQEKRVLKADAGWRNEPCTESQARRVMVVCRDINREFHGSATAFYQFALDRYNAGDSRYSRGGISTLMDRADTARG